MSSNSGSRFATNDKKIWIIVGVVLALVIGLAVGSQTIEGFWSTVAGNAFLILLVVGYFVPTIIAGKRKHHNLGAIIAVNLLLGWTLIGWIIALVWSLTAVRNPYAPTPVQLVGGQPQAAVQYQVGDVVNGHRFNGQTWEPLS